MKRSLSPFDDEGEANQINDSKKIKSDDDSYYSIRKASSKSESTPRLNLSNDKLFDKNDLFGTNKNERKEFDRKSSSSLSESRRDRYQPFDRKDRQEPFKFKSTSSLNKSVEFDHANFKIKMPISMAQTDLVKEIVKNKEQSNSSSYIFRKSGNQASVESTTRSGNSDLDDLRKKFSNLVKVKNASCKFQYSVRLTLNNKEIIVNSNESADEAEIDCLKLAITDLQNIPSIDSADEAMGEAMSDESNDSVVNEIKEFLKKQDKQLLFVDEIPIYYLRKFKRKIVDDWFEKVQNDSSFHVERHGSGNLVSVKLISI